MLKQPVTLIFGSDVRYRYQWYVAGTRACTNAAFGGDPAYGVLKSCWAAPQASCGLEGERCAPPNGVLMIAQFIRGGSLVALRGPTSGSFDCTGTTFGVPVSPGAYCSITAIQP